MSPWQKLVVFITSLFRSVPKLEKTQISFKQIMEKHIVLLSGRELPVSSVQCTLHWGRISTGTSYPAWRKPDKKTPCYINSGTVKGIKTGVACRRFWVELECPLSWFDHIHLTVYAFVKTNEMYALDLCASKFYLKKEHAFLGVQGLWDVSSLSRNPTLAPAVEARSPNHWATRGFWRRPVLIICSSVIQAHQWSDWGSQALAHSHLEAPPEIHRMPVGVKDPWS